MTALALLLCFSTATNNVAKARDTTALFDRFVAVNGSDRADGSRQHPWATLRHASENVKPGYVVHVMPGTYKEAVNTATGGAPTAIVRFVSEVKWGATIRSTGQAGWTNDADYVDIIGFDVSSDGYLGIFNRGSHVRILANHVHHVATHGCTDNGGAGILNGNYYASDNEVIGNVVHDIGEPSKSCPRVHGIYQSNPRGQILNNISYGNEGYGIHLWHAATEVTIANNLLFNNRHGGILIGIGDAPYNGDPAHPVDHVIVANNIVVYNQNGYGIEELGLVGMNNRYLNNLVYRNNVADWRLLKGLQAGTISDDPRFIDYRSDGFGDYHLSSVSPAVARATNAVAVDYDIDGHLRPRQGYDVGPYQSGVAPSPAWPRMYILPTAP